MEKFYITTPIYYINDKPHIGHTYTTVCSDVLARYWRMQLGSDNVFFLTGTDEHGAKIEQKACEDNMKAEDLANKVSAEFQLAWDRLSISNNDFIRTTEKRHEEQVVDFMNRLKEAKTPKGNDAIFEGDYEGLYCIGCEKYYNEADLDNEGRCPDHLTRPKIMKEKNWFFRLSDYAEILQDMINNGDYDVKIGSRKNEVLGLLNIGLEDLAISRQSVEWGIPIPWDKEQTIYVWVEALMNYVTALGGVDGELFHKFWPAEVHVVGKDILKFHAVIWPAMLLAIGVDVPKLIFAHGFFTIDGQKMSKTLGNVIDPNDMVDKYGADATRYLVISQYSFGADGDIQADRFNDLYNAHLAGGLGNLVSRVTAMTQKYFEGKAPACDGDDPFDVQQKWNAYNHNMSEYKIFESVHVIAELIGEANKYIEDQKPWELAKSDEITLGRVIYNLLEVIRHIAVMSIPIMPDISDQIFESLGFKAEDLRELSMVDLTNWGMLENGATITKGESLFPRLDK